MPPRFTAACGIVLLAVCSVHAQGTVDADTKELRTYELTVSAMKQFVTATRNMAAAAKKDPRYRELVKRRAEIEQLAAKEEMTEADKQRLEKLRADLEAFEDQLPGLSLNASEKMTLSDLEAQIRREPIAADALKSAGMSPREYATFALAFFQAAMIHGMQQSGMIKEVPKELQAQINMNNLKFVAEHQAEIKALMAELQALNPQ